MGKIRLRERKFVFNENEKRPEVFDRCLNEKICSAVQNYLIANLDKHHYRLVRDIEHPKEVLKALDTIQEPNSKTTLYSLNIEFGSMRYDVRAEPILDFVM